MAIRIECEECGHRERVDDDLDGGSIDCSECGAEIEIERRRGPQKRRSATEAWKSQSRLEAGSVLSRAVSTVGANLVSFGILALIIYSPFLLFAGWVAMQPQLTEELILIYVGVSIPLGLLLDNLMVSTVCYGVFEQLRGKHASVGDCLSAGLTRLPGVLAVGVLVFICVLAGLVACIIPGVIVACMLWFAVPAATVERPGVIESLKRSYALTNGIKLQIFGILFAINIVENMLDRGIQAVLEGSPVILFTGVVTSMIFGLVRATAAAIAYHDARAGTEGVTADDLAEVFE